MPICTVDYWERLKTLKLYSVERRRERFIILYIYRFIIGLIKIPIFNVFLKRSWSEESINILHLLQLRRSAKAAFCTEAHNFIISFLQNSVKYRELTNRAKFMLTLSNYNFTSTWTIEPTTPGLRRVAASNSLVHQIPLREKRRRDGQ